MDIFEKIQINEYIKVHNSIIDTPRLHLRPLCLEDVAPCTAYMNNYEVTKWLTNPPFPYSEEDARGFINHMMETSAPVWALTNSDGFMGTIGLHELDTGTIEFGYWIAQEFWGNGYVSEAALAVVTDFFATSEQDDLYSGYYLGNDKSQAILTKLGFVPHIEPKMIHSKARNEAALLQKVRLTRQAWNRLA